LEINSHPISSINQLENVSSIESIPGSLQEPAIYTTSNTSHADSPSKPQSFLMRPSHPELSAQDLADVFTSITASPTTTAQDQSQQLINLMKELLEAPREQNILVRDLQKGQERITTQLENLTKTLSVQVPSNTPKL